MFHFLSDVCKCGQLLKTRMISKAMFDQLSFDVPERNDLKMHGYTIERTSQQSCENCVKNNQLTMVH